MADKVIVYIVDDHPLICAGIKTILDGCELCTVTEIISDSIIALDMIRKSAPDIVVMDISMGEMSGLEILQVIRKESIPTKVIILTMHKEKALFLKALDDGVSGYLLKDSVQKELLDCVESVVNGKTYFSPSIWSDNEGISDYLSVLSSTKRQFDNLTQSEKNIIHLISKDHQTKEIAELLFISPKTVENHRSNICKKLVISGSNSLLKWVASNKRMIDFKFG